MNFPGIVIKRFEDVRKLFGEEEKIVILLLFILSGDIRGTLFMKLDLATAGDLLSVMFKDDKNKLVEYSELEISALKSIGNILSSSFVNVLGGFVVCLD